MNQNWLYKLERKFGKYRINGLMRYIVGIQIIGAVIGLINPEIYITFLSLDFSAVFRGQIWRLFTFLFYPGMSVDVGGMLTFAITVYLYYMIGNTLENVWGSFRFTLYYVSGVVLSVIAGFILYVTAGITWFTGFEYINMSLFLAFATIFPNMEFLLFFILPVKAKWLGIVDAVLVGYMFISNISSYFRTGIFIYMAIAVSIFVSLFNFIIFFLGSHKNNFSYKQHRRKAKFAKEAGPKVTPLYRHRCAICGKTERDDENLEFRYCSKCEGSYEYCSDHIYTHEHVHK